MQHQMFGLAGLGLVAALGCATASETSSGSEPASLASSEGGPREIGKPKEEPYRPGEVKLPSLGDEPDSAVGVELERGFLNQNEVNAVLEKHTATLISCYERAGEARRYAAGTVKLRFLVAASGEVTDVLVVGSQLGNYPVERCLVVEGRKIPFPKPGGGRPCDFDYELEFRSSQPHSVVDLKADHFGRKLSGRVPALGRCGSPGDGAVAAVAYIRPGGQVVSVGLQSNKPIDTLAAKCVVDQIHSWKLRGKKGNLVRTQFPIWKGTGGGNETASASAAPTQPLGPTARLRRARRR
jgi:hypothetical protein